MITFDTFYTIQRISGLSQDDKPLGMKPGSVFMELDTGKKYIFDGGIWHEQPTGGGGGGESSKWRKLRVIHCDGATQLYSFNTDDNGGTFEVNEVCVQFAATTATGGSGGNLQVGAGNKLVTDELLIGADCRHVLTTAMSYMKFAQASIDSIGRGTITQGNSDISSTIYSLQNAPREEDGTPYTAITVASRQDPFVNDMVITVWGR